MRDLQDVAKRASRSFLANIQRALLSFSGALLSFSGAFPSISGAFLGISGAGVEQQV